jgi:RHS repeat-associated protein
MVASDGSIYCYHFDALGSVIALTDMDQTIVNAYAYDPFGRLREQESLAQPFKYVGRYGVMHEPNGLYYMRARYYDPSVGRFISEDPIGFAGGDVNLYAYVQNDPVNFVDPNGLQSISINPLGPPMVLPSEPVTLSPRQWEEMKSFLNYFNPMPLVEWSVDKLISDPMEMAKGGRQRLDNEWSRDARLQPDPCAWLREQYDKAKDSTNRMKIKTAQKVLGCRQNSTKNDRCE